MILSNVVFLAIAQYELEEIGLFIVATQLIHLVFVWFTNRLTKIKSESVNKKEFGLIDRIFLSTFVVSPGIEVIKSKKFSFAESNASIQIPKVVKLENKSEVLLSVPHSHNEVKDLRSLKITLKDISNISSYSIMPKLKANSKRVSHSIFKVKKLYMLMLQANCQYK